MAIEFFIPKLGDNVKEATIVNWLVEDGARVDEGEEILEVETDKAVVPIPANATGYLHIGPYKAGDVAPVATVVATIGGQDEVFAPGSSEAIKDDTKQAEEKAKDRIEPRLTSPKVTPVARKMATKMGIDLQTITSSGKHGRITKEVVASYRHAADDKNDQPGENASPPFRGLTDQTITPPAQPAAEPVSPQPRPSLAERETVTSQADVLERAALKGIRGIIARRMAESAHTTARVTLVTEVDATGLVTLREKLKAKFSQIWGFAPGYNDLLGLIVANALRKFPYMNARLSATGDTIEYLTAVNIGLAVDTERGLVVTVIRDADTKGLQQFGSEFRVMVERARAGKSDPSDLSGGTFTITNLGMYRVDAFTPIINLPEAAILGVGRITPKPVVKEEEVIIRKMMTLSLVFDHRLTDGAPAARFLDYICELIEEPYLLFLTK